MQRRDSVIRRSATDTGARRRAFRHPVDIFVERVPSVSLDMLIVE